MELKVVSIEEFNALNKRVEELENLLKKKGVITQKYLRTKQVIEALNISRMQVKRLRDRKELKYVQKGTTIFYTPEAIEEYINKN